MIRLAVASVVGAAALATGAASSPPFAASYWSVDWSPNGRLIAFESNRDDPSHVGSNQVYVANAGGSNIRRLTTGGGMYGSGSPTWAPNSKRLAYHVGGAIAFVDVDGTRRGQISPGSGDVCCPVWSPRGRRIAFMDLAGESSIRATDPRGRFDAAIAEPSEGQAYVTPAWSPDGNRLAFAIGRDGDLGMDVQPGLGIVSSYRGRVVRYLRGREVRFLDWSRNGRFIALVDLRPGESWVSTYDLKTRHLRHLHAGSYPSWSPDSRRIAFVYAGAIYVMRADGTHVRRLIG